MAWRERREEDRRWRKKGERRIASPSAVLRYLLAFHDPEQEKERVEGKSFIPIANDIPVS